MMSNSNFQWWVLEVLAKNHFVSVPELGSFTLRELDSTLNTINFELKPRHTQLVFSTKFNTEDSSLIECVMSHTGSTYKSAIQLIKNEVSTLKEQLIQKKYYSFGSLGNFFYNPNSGIFFVGRNQSNLHTETFGLLPLKWENKAQVQEKTINSIHIAPVTSSTPEVEDATVTEIDSDYLDQSIEKHRSIKFWNVAASVALLSVSLGAVYLMTLSWNNVLNQQQTASQIAIPKLSQPSVEYVVVNGKLISTKPAENSSSDTLNTELSTEAKHTDFTIDEFRSSISKIKGKFFVVGGSYMTTSAAELECKHWQNLGYSATYIKVKNSSLLRIILNRFENEQDASDFAVSIKDQPTQSISVQNLQLQ
jgi:hypothetical protein